MNLRSEPHFDIPTPNVPFQFSFERFLWAEASQCRGGGGSTRPWGPRPHPNEALAVRRPADEDVVLQRHAEARDRLPVAGQRRRGLQERPRRRPRPRPRAVPRQPVLQRDGRCHEGEAAAALPPLRLLLPRAEPVGGRRPGRALGHFLATCGSSHAKATKAILGPLRCLLVCNLFAHALIHFYIYSVANIFINVLMDLFIYFAFWVLPLSHTHGAWAAERPRPNAPANPDDTFVTPPPVRSGPWRGLGGVVGEAAACGAPVSRTAYSSMAPVSNLAADGHTERPVPIRGRTQCET